MNDQMSPALIPAFTGNIGFQTASGPGMQRDPVSL